MTKVEVYYPASLQPSKYGVSVSKMMFSLLAEDRKMFHVNMVEASLYSDVTRNTPSPLGHRDFFTLPPKPGRNQWCNGGACRDDLNRNTWPSATELRIEIIVSQFISTEC